MKVYQERWLQKLLSADSKEQVVSVCEKIVRDDTGHTDALTQAIAKEYLQLSRKQDAKHDAALQKLVDIAQVHDMGYGDKA